MLLNIIFCILYPAFVLSSLPNSSLLSFDDQPTIIIIIIITNVIFIYNYNYNNYSYNNYNMML